MQCTADAAPRHSISVVIPTYRGSEKLLELVKSILKCNSHPAEVIVVADEPDPRVISELSKIQVDPLPLKLVVRGERRGKVSALNEASSVATGDILVFLDDDVLIEDSKFFEKISSAMEGCDILDIKKVIVGKGLLAKLVYMEYTAYNFVSKLMAKLAGRTIAINGAAFAVKRGAFELIGGFKPCLAEDLDFALRSFVRKCRFGYLDSTYVLNYAPSSWRHWFRQRKRWAVGFASWLKENYRTILRAIREMPHILIPCIILALPSLLTMSVAMSFYNFTYPKATYVALLSLALFIRELLPLTAAVSVTILVKYTLTTLLLGIIMVTVGALQLVMARLTRMKPYVYLIPLYLLFYQAIWFTVLVAGFVRVLAFGNERVDDWVV